MGSFVVRVALSLVMVGCAGGQAAEPGRPLAGALSDGASRKLTVLVDVVTMFEALSSELAQLGDAVRGTDKGVDARLKRCETSLSIARDAVGRATALQEREALALLDAFERNYADLVAELDIEGIRGADERVDDGSAERLRVMGPADMRAHLRARVAATVAR